VVTAILIGDRAGLDDEMQRHCRKRAPIRDRDSGGNIAIFTVLIVMLLRHCGNRTSCVGGYRGVRAHLDALLVGGGLSRRSRHVDGRHLLTAQFGDHRTAPGNVAAVSAMVLSARIRSTSSTRALRSLRRHDRAARRHAAVTRPAAMPGWLSRSSRCLAGRDARRSPCCRSAALVFSRVTAAGLVLNFAAIP